jgi:Mrp family chromosome partitioning ATPase
MDQVENKKPSDDNQKIAENLQKIKHKIMIMSGKGGVGKSTVAVNLAYDLSNQGLDVGLLDVDLHGPSTLKMLNIENVEVKGDANGIFPVEVPPHLKVMSMGLFLADANIPVIWRGPVKMGAIRQFLEEVHWGNLDYLIIDLPPGTGDEPLSIAQLIPDITGTVIITTPQEIALLDSKKAVNFAKTLKIPIIGIIENMSGFTCPHCGKSIDLFKVGGGENAAHELSVPFLGRIPLDQKIVEDCDNGTPFVASGDKSESTESFKEIVAQIEDFVN